MSKIVQTADRHEGIEDLKSMATEFETWQKGEGIPIHKTFHVEDLKAVELAPWARYGVRAAFVNLADCHITSAMVIELDPGQTSLPMKHMFESWCYIIDGVGQTSFDQEGTPVSHV